MQHMLHLNKEPDADKGKCRNCCILRADVGNQASRDSTITSGKRIVKNRVQVQNPKSEVAR